MASCCTPDRPCSDTGGRVPEDVVAECLPIVKAWAAMKDGELELRLLDVNASFYARASSMLAACTEGSAQHDVITDVMHCGGVRTRRFASGAVEHRKKTERSIVDLDIRTGGDEYGDFPATARLTAVCEEPVVPAGPVADIEFVRRQMRYSRVFPTFRVDASTVWQGASYKELEASMPRYEIELEYTGGPPACAVDLTTTVLLRCLGFCRDSSTQLARNGAVHT